MNGVEISMNENERTEMTFTEIHTALSAKIESYPDMSSEAYDDLSHALDLIDTWAGKLDIGIDEAYERQRIARYEGDIIRSHEG